MNARTPLIRACITALLAAFLLAAPRGPVAVALPAEAVAPVNDAAYTSAVQELLLGARKSLRLMLYQTRYYGEYPDTVTNRWVSDLIDARQRGVDVQVIVDTGNWNPSMKNDYNLDYVDRLTTAGVRIWEDAPDVVSHQKVILADDDLVLVASNNWTFYSLARNNEVAVVVQSRELNQWFGKYFEERKAEGKPRANASAAPDPSTSAGLTRADLGMLEWHPAVTVEPIPNRLFYPAVHEAIINARASVTVLQRSLTMYDRPPQRDERASLPLAPASETNVLAADLVAAHKRGVAVKVILDRSENMDDPGNDQTAAYLQRHGVPVFRDDLQTQTHAKLVVIDDDKVVVGSTNWTRPALEDGNEASVLVTSREVNKVYQEYVASILRSAAPYQAISRSIWDTTTSTAPQAQDKQAQ